MRVNSVLKDFFQLIYLSLVRQAFKAMPFSLGILAAKGKGLYKYFFDRSLRGIVLNNVYQAFADVKSRKELLKLTQSILKTAQVCAFCAYFHEKLSDRQIENRFPVRGLENLDNALQKGKGVILFSGHLGPHFIARYLLRQKGYQVRGLRFKGAEDNGSNMRNASRLRARVEKLKIKRYVEPPECYFQVDFNARPVFKFLKQNGILINMGDGVHSLTYKKMDFLNNSIPFSLGTMSLARSTGATVLPVYLQGTPGNKDFETRIGEPFALQVTEDRQADIEENTLIYVRCLEKQITEYPHNWRNWMYRDYFTRLEDFVSQETDKHSKVFGHGLSA
ncbi:MAG: lysophospholipid acyltransferase family protein [bacterium]